MEKKITPPVTYGLIIALILVVFGAVTVILKQDTNRTLSLIPLAVMIGGIVWACTQYAKQMDGNVTFGNVFGHGFKATALVAGIMGFWVAISLALLFPESLDRAMDMQREAMEKQGLSESVIDQNLALGKKLAVPMGTIVTVILYLAVGAVGALIGAGVAKKNPQPSPFQ